MLPVRIIVLSIYITSFYSLQMCHYCHVLKNNPRAPHHPSIRCLDRSNTYSQVPIAQRIYDRGQSIFSLPSAPPAEGSFRNSY